MSTKIHVGCAGWTLRKDQFPLSPNSGSHLERYAARFNCVEINSSFYRSHRPSTYRRWADVTPPTFRFAVKLPKQITHVERLKSSNGAIDQFGEEVAGLGRKLGVVLVQLPPTLRFDPDVATEFFRQLTAASVGPVAIEPRHASWFDAHVGLFLNAHGIGRVAADPAVTSEAAEPVSANGITYYRWHGVPRMYYSSYDEPRLNELAGRLISAISSSTEVWCIFDNTAEGAATTNALSIKDLIGKLTGGPATQLTR
jgi:uncharacterized protein YecE (DUF72 family)